MAKQSASSGKEKRGRSIKPSALKRSRQNEKRRARNLSIKTGTKSAVKKLVKAVVQGNKSEAIAAFNNAAPALQKAAAKGILHKKNAARKISRMAQKINKLS